LGDRENANVKHTCASDSTLEPNPVEITCPPGKRGKKGSALSPELTELVAELKETVKRIDPRQQTPRTLRRTLSLVDDILGDIDRLTLQKP
jgi:hypothetical protein